MTISIPDLINGMFEACGSVAILSHCRQVLKDKMIKGVSIPSVIFFTAWGAYNCFFYPHLHQWLSFAGGLFIFTANLFWIYLMWKYKDKNHP
jgi:hypothetical protein